MIKAEFSVLLQSSVSRDPSEINADLLLVKHLLLCSMLETVFAAEYFCGNCDTLHEA